MDEETNPQIDSKPKSQTNSANSSDFVPNILTTEDIIKQEKQAEKKRKKQEKLAKKAEKKRKKQENSSYLSVNQLVKPIVFIIVSLVLEVITFAVLKFKSNSTGGAWLLPKYIFFDLAFWIFLAGIMLVAKNWMANVIFYVFTIIQLVLCVGNSIAHSDFGYFFTWSMLALAGEATNSFDSSFLPFKTIFMCVGLLLAIIIVPILMDLLLKKRKVLLTKISKPVFGLIAFLCSFFLSATCYSVQALTLNNPANATYETIESDKYLYQNMHIREEAYKNFGTCGFYIKDLYDVTLSKLFVSGYDEITSEIKNSVAQVNTSATLYGDNLIVIMLESFEWFAIDPYNTPNLYKLKTGTDISGTSTVPSRGVAMTNYVSNNKTNIGEDTCLLGYMPNINKLHLKDENTLSAQYSLPNIFKNEGYTTSYFHNWKKDFYDRNTQNIYLGFDNFYSIDDFESENKSTQFNQFNKEADFVTQMASKMAPADKKFMSFYTTVATHGSYEVTNSKCSENYDIYDSNLESYKTWMAENGYKYPETERYQKILRQYKTMCIDTDNMVGILFDYLSKTTDYNGEKLINNTTVVLYADHNAYYNDLSYELKSTTLHNYENTASFTVPLMIYSKKLSAQTNTTFCNVYDLYPTISSLFGVGYNKFFAQGYNIFSDEISNSVHVSFLTGFYTQNCYSRNMINFTLSDGGTDADIERFKKSVDTFYKKQEKIEKVYKFGWSRI